MKANCVEKLTANYSQKTKKVVIKGKVTPNFQLLNQFSEGITIYDNISKLNIKSSRYVTLTISYSKQGEKGSCKLFHRLSIRHSKNMLSVHSEFIAKPVPSTFQRCHIPFQKAQFQSCLPKPIVPQARNITKFRVLGYSSQYQQKTGWKRETRTEERPPSITYNFVQEVDGITDRTGRNTRGCRRDRTTVYHILLENRKSAIVALQFSL